MKPQPGFTELCQNCQNANVRKTLKMDECIISNIAKAILSKTASTD